MKLHTVFRQFYGNLPEGNIDGMKKVKFLAFFFRL
jgi:hypothetical protein